MFEANFTDLDTDWNSRKTRYLAIKYTFNYK